MNLTVEEHLLANQTMAYWANFAKTGDPNGEGLACLCKRHDVDEENNFTSVWPEFSPENDLQLYMGTPSNYAAVDNLRSFCDFWSDLGFQY